MAQKTSSILWQMSINAKLSPTLFQINGIRASALYEVKELSVTTVKHEIMT